MAMHLKILRKHLQILDQENYVFKKIPSFKHSSNKKFLFTSKLLNIWFSSQGNDNLVIYTVSQDYFKTILEKKMILDSFTEIKSLQRNPCS